MKKIAVIGLYSIRNAGDNILCEATSYLLKKELPDAEIIPVDVNPRIGAFHGLGKIPFLISKVLIHLSGYFFRYENAGRFRYIYEYFMWWLKVNGLFRKKLKDADAAVFAGGGFLKFRTQGLNYDVEQIVKICEKRNIPVMMNAVGIEGFDLSDIRCRRLREAINRPVVKVITTRDDIDTLQNCYKTNPALRAARAGDPALWLPECFGISGGERGDTIGVNVIWSRIYRTYGGTLSEEGLLDFYVRFIRGMEERGMKWILFSNGMPSDIRFGKALLQAIGAPPDRLLPAPENTEAFLSMIRTFRCVFGARLHACITAYALDVPAVGLIWSEKLRFFSEIIGKEGAFFEEDEMDVPAILDAIERESESGYDTEIRENLKETTRQYLKLFLKETGLTAG